MKVNFWSSVEFLPGLREKEGKTGGLKQGPWATSLFFNQPTSELLHSILHLMNQYIRCITQ